MRKIETTVNCKQSISCGQWFLGKVFVCAIILNLLILSYNSFSQNTGVSINVTGALPNSKALLDVDATGMSPKAGVLIPRMSTADRNAITGTIPESLLIYNTDTHCFEAYYNGGWVGFGCLNSGCQAPVALTTGANTPSEAQITWNWSAVSGATGYKWNTSTAYNSATDISTSLSYSLTGLSCGTAYSLFLWAYNICGNSTYTSLTQTTSACSCLGSGFISTIAGCCGGWSYNGDGIPATSAILNLPNGVAVDQSGNVFIADQNNNRIREVVNSTGFIYTIAGNGSAGYNGDGIAATNAKLHQPMGLAVDVSGNVYVADALNTRVRKITISSGLISTIAGGGAGGDGGPATNASLWYPYGVAVDVTGNVYIAENQNNTVREVSISNGFINTIAGTGIGGYNGDGILAVNAELYTPVDVAVDNSGNVYIADYYNGRIRKITKTTGIISTIAGNGGSGYNGDGIAATSAEFNELWGISLDGSGNVYIADCYNQIIRKVTVASGLISTIAGGGAGGDGGPATNASLSYPWGVFVDNSGNVYISDQNNNKIRKVCY